MKFGIVIYEDAEPIDLATVGVLSMARRVAPEIEYATVAEQAGVVRMANGLRVLADYGFDEAPAFDVLVIVGGPGWRKQTKNAALLRFFQARAASTLVSSVCTGGMILAAAGLLDGKSATTKVEVVPPEVPPLKVLQTEFPDVHAMHASVVDEGSVVTGGGVTLCIDTMLYLLKTRMAPQVAEDTARIIEYTRAWRANELNLPVVGSPTHDAPESDHPANSPCPV